MFVNQSMQNLAQAAAEARANAPGRGSPPPPPPAAPAPTPPARALDANNQGQRSADALRSASAKVSPGIFQSFKNLVTAKTALPTGFVQQVQAAQAPAPTAAAGTPTAPARAARFVAQLGDQKKHYDGLVATFGAMRPGDQRTVAVDAVVGVGVGVGGTYGQVSVHGKDFEPTVVSAEASLKGKVGSLAEITHTAAGQFEITLDHRMGGELGGTVGVGDGVSHARGLQKVARLKFVCATPDAAARVLLAHQMGRDPDPADVVHATELTGRRTTSETVKLNLLNPIHKATAVGGGFLNAIRRFLPGLSMHKVECHAQTLSGSGLQVEQRTYSLNTVKANVLSWLSLGWLVRKRTATQAGIDITRTTGTTREVKAELSLQIDASKLRAMTKETPVNRLQSQLILVNKETDRLFELMQTANGDSPRAFDTSPEAKAALKAAVKQGIEAAIANLGEMRGDGNRLATLDNWEKGVSNSQGAKLTATVQSGDWREMTGSVGKIVTIKIPFRPADDPPHLTLPDMQIDPTHLEVGVTSFAGGKVEAAGQIGLWKAIGVSLGAGGARLESAFAKVAVAGTTAPHAATTPTPVSVQALMAAPTSDVDLTRPLLAPAPRQETPPPSGPRPLGPPDFVDALMTAEPDADPSVVQQRFQAMLPEDDPDL